MQARDWRFVAEGGRHALFEYRGIAALPLSGPAAGREDWLLHLRKADLARSEPWMAANGRDGCSQEPMVDITGARGEDPVRFIRDIVSPKLGEEYLDIPICVSLAWSFVCELRRQTLELDEIPPRRRQGWYAEESQAVWTDEEHSVTGRLVPNYTRWGGPSRCLTRQSLRPDDGAAAADCIAVEIKPKAGYTAISPLVDPRRRAKCAESRFVLLQRLYARGRVHKAWRRDDSGGPPEPSRYDPCDLFSGDADRVRAAVAALLACPQNNFRVWSRRRLRVGVDHHGRDMPGDRRSLAECLGVAADRVESTLVGAASSILIQENILRRLLELQTLDIIDGDGAVLIHRRLVDLLGGSQEAARELLDDYVGASPSPCTRDETGSELHPLLSHSAIRPPPDVSRINRFCQHVDQFRQTILSQKEDLSTNALGFENFRQSALKILGSFDLHDCRFLLQNWLLSLAMNDLGVFIRCVRLSNAATDGTLCSRAMNVAEPGIVLVSPTIVLQYDVKVIDCDRKPASKLRERLKKEEIYNLLNDSQE